MASKKNDEKKNEGIQEPIDPTKRKGFTNSSALSPTIPFTYKKLSLYPTLYSSHLYIDSYSVITPMCLVDVWLRAFSPSLAAGMRCFLAGRGESRPGTAPLRSHKSIRTCETNDKRKIKGLIK